MNQLVIIFVFLCIDDDCEWRLQRLREVVVIKFGDFVKYVSSSCSCEVDDEFDDDEEKGGEEEMDFIV